MNYILALDASGKTGGIAILNGSTPLYVKTIHQGLTHSETLLSLVEKALAATNLTPAEISLFAITNGPGSFTGLRIGLSLIKGLAMPYGTPVAPVSTLLALAMAANQHQHEGNLISALDARRNEVYWAGFELSPKAGHMPIRLTKDSAGPAADIAKISLFQSKPVFFVGDGAEICYTMNRNCMATLNYHGSTPIDIAYGAALVAYHMQQSGQAVSAAAVAPVYLRLSQAERERAAKLASTTG